MLANPSKTKDNKFQWCSNVITHWAGHLSNAIAINDPVYELSYSEFETAIVAAAGALTASGVRAGDRVAILTENCVATVIAICATQRLRAWAVPLNARLSSREVDEILGHCRPRVVITTDQFSPQAVEHGQKYKAAEHSVIFGQWGARLGHYTDPGKTEKVSLDPTEQVAALIYTSGTTGAPKGVMLTHSNLMFIAARNAEMRKLTPKDWIYAVLPLSHVYGLGSSFNGAMLHGSRFDLVPRFDPDHVAERLANHPLTIFQGVPQMYARLMALADERGGLVAPHLRLLSAGGAPLDLTLKRRVEACFNIALNNGYGVTETSPTISSTRSEDPVDNSGTGPPLDGIEVRIAGKDNQPLDVEEVGEVQSRGPHVMKGYYRAPDLTKEVMTKDNFYRTGDLGHFDEKGHLFIDGRLKELIIRSGFNIYPPEVEGVLTEIEGLAIAAVIGVPDVDSNEQVIAFIEPDPGYGFDDMQLDAHARNRLAPYKCPARYVIMDALPAASTGKILKHKLKDYL